MAQFGGHAMFLSSSALHAGSGQKDIAADRGHHLPAWPTPSWSLQSQRVIDEVVANSTVPVMSA